MISENPYQSPTLIPPPVAQQSPHRSFRLTTDSSSQSRHFKIGTTKDAIVFAAIQQFVLMLLMSMVLDGGVLFQRSYFAFAAFWILALIAFIIRTGKFTESDVLVIKWGYMPIFLITANVCSWYDFFL